jgi:hypothetical protein
MKKCQDPMEGFDETKPLKEKEIMLFMNKLGASLENAIVYLQKHGFVEAFDRYIEDGKYVIDKNYVVAKQTPLIHAIKSRKLELVKYLVEKCQADFKNDRVKTAIDNCKDSNITKYFSLKFKEK